jgi:hypothetical protein
MKAGQHPKWKDKSQGQHGLVVPFMWFVGHNREAPSEQRKWWYVNRLFETSGLKERVM